MEISAAWLLLPFGFLVLGAVLLVEKMGRDLDYCIKHTMANRERRRREKEEHLRRGN